MVRPRHIGQTRPDTQDSRQHPGSQRNIHTITHRAPVDAVAWKSIAYNPATSIKLSIAVSSDHAFLTSAVHGRFSSVVGGG